MHLHPLRLADESQELALARHLEMFNLAGSISPDGARLRPGVVDVDESVTAQVSR